MWQSVIIGLMLLALVNANSTFSNEKMSEKIIAGFGLRAYNGEFGHMAAVGWTTTGKVEYKCGGTLISQKFVLTAAHCAVDNKSKPPDIVRLGDTHLESEEDDEYAQHIKIRAFKRHPDHVFSMSYFDIALIELENCAGVTQAVDIARLWLEHDLPTGKMQAVGFGKTELADYSPTLQKVTLSIIAKKKCNKFVRWSWNFPSGILNHQFCAKHRKMQTCSGDSGGPLQVIRKTEYGFRKPLVVGIISSGPPCTMGSVGIYTQISMFQEWIDNETNNATCLDEGYHEELDL